MAIGCLPFQCAALYRWLLRSCAGSDRSSLLKSNFNFGLRSRTPVWSVGVGDYLIRVNEVFGRAFKTARRVVVVGKSAQYFVCLPFNPRHLVARSNCIWSWLKFNFRLPASQSEKLIFPFERNPELLVIIDGLPCKPLGSKALHSRRARIKTSCQFSKTYHAHDFIRAQPHAISPSGRDGQSWTNTKGTTSPRLRQLIGALLCGRSHSRPPAHRFSAIALLGRGLDAIVQHDLAGMAPDITAAARLHRYENARQLRRALLSPEAREIEQLREQFGRHYQTAWRNGQRPDLTQLPQHFAAIDKEQSHA